MQTVNGIQNPWKKFLRMINIRGKMIPIISLNTIFSETEKTLDSKKRIMIVHNRNQEIGMVVDEVNQVMFLVQQHIHLPIYPRIGG
jgi:purine-binding chemotaxis protein CheW